MVYELQFTKAVVRVICIFYCEPLIPFLWAPILGESHDTSLWRGRRLSRVAEDGVKSEQQSVERAPVAELGRLWGSYKHYCATRSL